jgi:hypothetical protein
MDMAHRAGGGPLRRDVFRSKRRAFLTAVVRLLSGQAQAKACLETAVNAR